MINRRGVPAPHPSAFRAAMDRFGHRLRLRARHWPWILVRTILVVGISYIILYPILVKLSVSFMSREDLYDMTIRWLPKHPTLANFQRISTLLDYGKTLSTTVLLSGASTLLQVGAAILVAYGFARFEFRGRRFLFLVVMLTLIVPPQTYSMTSYLTFRYFDPFGLLTALGIGRVSMINTPLPILLLSATCMAAKNGLLIYLMRQFFRNMPLEMEEAAWVDGAGVGRTLVSVMLPNALPAIASVLVFSFVWNWNDLYSAALYMPKMQLLPILLSTLPSRISTSFGGWSNIDFVSISVLSNAGSLLLLLPILAFFRAMQRFFVEGIERTGLTGL